MQRLWESAEMKAEDTGLSRSQIEDLIEEWIFSERDRKILERRLLDGVTFDQLAAEFDLTARQIKNIVYKSEDRLFRHV